MVHREVNWCSCVLIKLLYVTFSTDYKDIPELQRDSQWTDDDKEESGGKTKIFFVSEKNGTLLTLCSTHLFAENIGF